MRHDCSSVSRPYNSSDGAWPDSVFDPGDPGFDQKERILKRLFGACCSAWLVRACSSSIGKKVIMALTGLALCGFLVVHLGGNLLLYVGPKEYNHYAAALHSQKLLLPIAEIGLLILFVVHIWLAFVTKSENDAARPIGYAMKQTKMAEGPLAAPASSVMFITGIVVLLFLILHLADFRFGLRGSAPAEPGAIEAVDYVSYHQSRALLSDWVTFVVYIIGSLFLGYHVLHGFQSAFQTLGINHPKYTPAIRTLSVVFGIVVALGFASFPLWAMAFKS